ncbi:GPI-anchored surface protein, putative [Bodo saltans]|uniref:GPI-anchored surface protein, putative n=1 Tax=Bodo saltans TaxID=75058 RepID=A0A0S4J041_BODSA|nr:GPI-anchored surface protein, putative [Bodo saltans]|eukprot:CUG69588.1 GPI-anchored surface protein, putative [Bodo saltans]
MTIPCNADSFMLFSYNDYTIRDCTRPGGSPFLFLGTSPNASALIDVSITVLNGAVIPQLFSNTIARLENVSVLISGARVGPYHRVITAPTQSPSLSIVTVYSAAFEPFVAKNISMIVHNITVVINTSTPVHDWNVDIHGDFLLSLPLGGPAEVNGLLVNVTDSVIVLHFDGHPLYRNLGIVAVDFQSARSKLAHVSIYVAFSTISIVVDMALTNFTREMSPCHFHFVCRLSGCSASKISYAAHDNSLLRMEYTMPGYGNAAPDAIHWLVDSAGIFATRDFSDISAIAFDLHNTSASVSCDCRTRCGFLTSGERGLLSAAVFLINSINVDDAVTQNVTAQISLASLSISAPMDAYAVLVSFLLNVSTVSVTIANANVSILGAGLYIGGEARTDSVVGFIKIKFGSRIMAALSHIAQSVVHESGGCASATASMLTFTGNFSKIIATLHQVSLNAQSVRGVVVPSDLVPGLVTFAVVTTLASLITLAPYSLIPTYYYYVDIIINSSTIEAAHVTNALPGTSYATVASMVSAFSVVTPVASSSVTLLGVRVVRRRPSTVDVDPDSWIPETFSGARSNVTATVTMFNPLSFFLSSIRDPLIHAIASSIAGSGVISLVNVTVNVTLHCVVEYEVGMLPSIVDVPSLLVLPNEANFSRFYFSDSTLRIPLGSEGVGSLVAGYSKATLYETQISMKAIRASSSVLLLTKSNTLTVVLGPTLSMYLIFLDISLVAPLAVGVGASSFGRI